MTPVRITGESGCEGAFDTQTVIGNQKTGFVERRDAEKLFNVAFTITASGFAIPFPSNHSGRLERKQQPVFRGSYLVSNVFLLDDVSGNANVAAGGAALSRIKELVTKTGRVVPLFAGQETLLPSIRNSVEHFLGCALRLLSHAGTVTSIILRMDLAGFPVVKMFRVRFQWVIAPFKSEAITACGRYPEARDTDQVRN